MTSSGFEITTCPHCGHLYKNRIIVSHNTFGIRQYSDGHLGGLSLNITTIKKCDNTNCKKLFNTKDAISIGKISQDKNKDLVTAAWLSAKSYNSNRLNVEDLEDALKTDFVNEKENEINVRTLLLWLHNDTLRESRISNLSENAKINSVNNIKRLILLLENSITNSQKLILAELYREISEFNNCISTLTSITSATDDEQELKEKIYSQARVKDEKVFNIEHVVIKKEFKCDNCEKSLILFDLEKTPKPWGYKYYRCNIENTIFSDTSMVINPSVEYKISVLQKVLKLKAPYQKFIKKEEIYCKKCNSINTELFNPITAKCIHCHTGNYNIVKWF